MSTYSVIIFDNQKSNEAPYGQKGAYPLAHAQLAYGRNISSGPGDKHSAIEMDSTYIMPFDNNDSSATHHDLVRDLNAILQKATTNKSKPDTITVLHLVAGDDAANYKVVSGVEHQEAVVRYSRSGSLVINANKATLATIPMGKDDATDKTEFDFVNRRINGK